MERIGGFETQVTQGAWIAHGLKHSGTSEDWCG